MFKGLFSFLSVVGAYFLMIFQVGKSLITSPPRFRLVANQMYEMGVMSLPVVAITGFSTGMVLSAQSFFQLSEYGLTAATGLMVTKAMLVELGPILTAFMVTGRVGAGMCAELGSMKVTEQIDALKSMAIDPINYQIVPRFISAMVMFPLLSVFSALMGSIGGMMIAVYLYGMAPAVYFDPLPVYVTKFDIVSGFIKSFVFSLIIVSISCFRGLRTRGGAAGVGQATTNSVVLSYATILIANFFVTLFLNSSYQYINAIIKKVF